MKAKTVVYTAIAGNHDQLLPPENIQQGIDYVCFTDNPDLKSNVWQIRPFTEAEYKFSQGDPVRLARRVKVLPHEHFPDYETSIWMDANLLLRGDMHELMRIGLADCDFATWEMPERVLCTYKQAEALMKGNYDDPAVIAAQMRKYRLLGFPENNADLDARGVMSCVLVRRHMQPDLMRAMYDWWAEIALHSRRDQLSFHYIAWKNQLRYHLYDGNARDNRFFLWRRHDSTVAKLRNIAHITAADITQQLSGRQLVVWGAGSAARQSLEVMPELQFGAVIDSNPALWGSEVYNLPICPPADLRPESHFVVIGSSYLHQIAEQLENCGFKPGRDYSPGISAHLLGLVNYKDL